jgi:hypothetical protein
MMHDVHQLPTSFAKWMFQCVCVSAMPPSNRHIEWVSVDHGYITILIKINLFLKAGEKLSSKSHKQKNKRKELIGYSAGSQLVLFF